MKEIFSDAIKYWEKKRILYNIGLAVIVLIYFIAGLPGSINVIDFNWALILIVLALIANVLYCFAYFVDVYVQFSEYAEIWKKYRWILFVIGFCLAAIITRFMVMDIFNRH